MSHHGKCYFQENWLTLDEFQNWLRPHANKSSAYCCVCKCEINVLTMGISALRSHERGMKHKKNIGAVTQLRMDAFINKKSTVAGDASSSTTNTASSSAVPDDDITICSTSSGVTKVKTSIASSFKDIAITSEVLWCLLVIEMHWSLRSTDNVGLLFKQMFPDSAIASQFSLGRDKASYIIKYGLSPHFHQLVKNSVSGLFSISYDESLNFKVQKSQMDVNIRYWSETESKAVTRYWDSQFLGSATSEDLLQSIIVSTKELKLGSLLQVHMDGPNVNLKLFDLLTKRLVDENECGTSLINIGTCSLHSVHRAFEAGHTASMWKINSILCSLYYLFKDSPSRRAAYIAVTQQAKFFPKFCSHRWIENGKAAKFAIDHWNNLVSYVLSFDGKSNSKKPKVHSFIELENAVKDKLTLPKLHFFLSVANDIEPFLTFFQSDAPLIPFLCDHYMSLVKTLLFRILKHDVVAKANSAVAITNIDLFDNSIMLKTPQVGFGASQCINSLVVSDLNATDVTSFNEQCNLFLVTTCRKLLEKCPLRHTFVRYTACLNPKKIAGPSHENNISNFKGLLQMLLNAKRMDSTECDSALQQYNKFTMYVNSSDIIKDAFSKFNEKVDRFDDFYSSHLNNETEYQLVWMIVKIVAIMFHGQADVERGFSVNKQMLRDNMDSGTFVAFRHVHDAIHKAGGVTNINITSNLLKSVRLSRQRYRADIEAQKAKIKEDEISTVGAVKRKREEVHELEVLRAKSSKTAKALLQEADDECEAAERKHDLVRLSKANALRKASKDKQQEADELSSKISNLQNDISLLKSKND